MVDLLSQLTGYWLPQLMYIINPMLEEDPAKRPSSFGALQAFDKITGYRLGQDCHERH